MYNNNYIECNETQGIGGENVARFSMRNNSGCSMLGQELAKKAGELEFQRRMREAELVNITLDAIADRVESKKDDVLSAMSEKGSKLKAVCEIVIRGVIKAAEGLLWCPEHLEKLSSEQHVRVFTGSHWESIETQRWKDFVAQCAERCGVPESMRMDVKFMRLLIEGTAYNLSKSLKQRIPDNEVWLNLRNGVLILNADGTVQLRDHCKEDLFPYTLNYAYDPQADCPQWHKFLDRVLPEPESQQVLREYIGYCLMKDHRLERMLLLYGDGLNGKSVTLEIIEYLLGSMNVSYLSLSDLTNDDVKRAGFKGKKLNISHESGKDVNPNVLKQLTSGERVLIKFLYRDPVETNDYGKLIAAFNQLPRAENTFGFFRRLIILPYEVTIPKEEIDRQLPSKLKTEISGILNWVLEALPALMTAREFTECEKCEKAMEQYRLQADNVRLFLNEACESSESTTQASDLHRDYKNFCIEASLKPLGRNKFIERLESLGYESILSGNIKYFKIKVI